MFLAKALLGLALPLFCSGALWHKEFAAARGRITCPSDPGRVNGAQADLYEQDFFGAVDHPMDKKMVDSSGCFEVRGSARDLVGKIEPTLYVYHNCGKNKEKPWCPNKNKINLSKLKIYTDSANPVWNDMGVINLENGQSSLPACGHKFFHPSTWGDNKQPEPATGNRCPWEPPPPPFQAPPQHKDTPPPPPSQAPAPVAPLPPPPTNTPPTQAPKGQCKMKYPCPYEVRSI